jgi:hypothetical protein
VLESGARSPQRRGISTTAFRCRCTPTGSRRRHGTTKKLLRVLAGAELRQVEDARDGQKRPIIRYVVKSGGDERIFSRPHEAWAHFQQLTKAPDRDVRPEPPPLTRSN